MATSDSYDSALRNSIVDHEKRANRLVALLTEYRWTAVALLVIALIAIFYFVFRPSSSEGEKVTMPAKPAVSATTQKNGKRPNTEPNQARFSNNPTIEVPPPVNVQESGEMEKAAKAPAPQSSAPVLAQAPAAAASPQVIPQQKEATQHPVKVAKVAPPVVPQKKDAVITEYRHPVSPHKVVMGGAGGYVKVADVRPMYYSSEEQCVAMQRAGRAVMYHPTMKSKDYGPNRAAGLSLRGGEAPSCAEMDTAAGLRWVAFEQGREFLTKGPEVMYLAECQNKIHRIVFIKKEQPMIALPPVPPAPPVAQETAVPTTVIEERKILKVIPYCELPDGTQVKATIQNGEAVCPDLKFRAPVAVDQPIRIQPRALQAPPAPSQPPVSVPPVAMPQAPATCTNCTPHPHVDITRKVPRTDGRCVVAFQDPRGGVHYARFDTSTVNGDKLLVAAKVDSVAGEWNRSYVPTYVGFGTSQTVRLRGAPSCEAAVNALKDDRVFAWTAPRLGLDPGCTVVGPVKDL